MDENIPRHIVFIPDGNRRWAENKGMGKREGYAIGIAHIEEVLGWCRSAGIEMVTMWGFSADNFKRDRDEVAILFELFKKNLVDSLATKREERNRIRIRFLGRAGRLPREISELFRQVEEKTGKNGPYQLNLLLSYGGREEIVDAVNAIIKEGIREVDEATLSKHLYTAGLPDPDLIIRTSGEQRLSGLMPWQSAYSEFYFTKKLWPDFSKSDFEKALKEYARRKRRYGK